ncbi:MAG: hypothetical protein R3F03_11190 [Opitutaceae bacterium]
MKIPRAISLCVLVSCLWLTGCVSTDSSLSAPEHAVFGAYKSPYPGNSGVTISATLEKDAITSLKAYLKQLHGSAKFEIIDRQSLDEKPEFVIDGLGRLVAGNLHEVWIIKRGDQTEKLEFIMFPDGKRGNTVGFRPYAG